MNLVQANAYMYVYMYMYIHGLLRLGNKKAAGTPRDGFVQARVPGQENEHIHLC